MSTMDHPARLERKQVRMRRGDGDTEFVCDDYPSFRPNVSPGEIFKQGAFGGTYFRDITIDSVRYRNAWQEFATPVTDWFDGLDIKTQVASSEYRAGLNKYRVKCGQSLEVWVSKGWIKTQFDSHESATGAGIVCTCVGVCLIGWFHWYCRFFLGCRCDDDERQIARWAQCAGRSGRWKRNLIAKCVRAGKPYNDYSVSPVVRQTLLHWAYELTETDFEEYAAELRAGKRTSFVPQYTMRHVVSNDAEDEEPENGPNRESERNTATGSRRVSNDSEPSREASERSLRAAKRARRS